MGPAHAATVMLSGLTPHPELARGNSHNPDWAQGSNTSDQNWQGYTVVIRVRNLQRKLKNYITFHFITLHYKVSLKITLKKV